MSERLESPRQQVTSVGEDVEKKEVSYTVGKNANWYNQCWKTLQRFLKKLKILVPYDPVIPLLGIYPNRMKTLI